MKGQRESAKETVGYTFLLEFFKESLMSRSIEKNRDSISSCSSSGSFQMQPVSVKGYVCLLLSSTRLVSFMASLSSKTRKYLSESVDQRFVRECFISLIHKVVYTLIFK